MVSLSLPEVQGSSLVLFVSWLLIPAFALFAISEFTPITLLSPRYFASVTPAVAALAGWGSPLFNRPRRAGSWRRSSRC